MKKFQILSQFMLIVVILMVVPSLAQTTKVGTLKRHEIGLNLFSSLSNTYFVNIAQRDGYNHNYFNGLLYKHHLSNKDALRFYVSTRSSEYQSGSKNGYSQKYFEHAYQAGYQRFLNKGRLRFFGSMNLHLRLGVENTAGVQGSDSPRVEYERNTTTFGPSPVLGVQFAITKRIGISIETSVEYSLELERIKGYNYGGGMSGEAPGPISHKSYAHYWFKNPVNSLNVSYRF